MMMTMMTVMTLMMMMMMMMMMMTMMMMVNMQRLHTSRCSPKKKDPAIHLCSQKQSLLLLFVNE